MNEIQNIETKVENGGTTPQGRVSAAEFNIITDAAKRFDVSKYGAARISEGGQLQFFADAASMASYEADPQTNAALLLKSLSLPTSDIDISGKLDKAEFYRYFEEVNIGTAEAPVYATRSKRGLFSDSFLSSLGLNSSGGGGTGGGSYDRLDAWADYTAERAGWVLSAGLGYDLNTRVKLLESGSALSFTDEGAGNVVTAVKKSGTAVVVTKGLTALTSHQPIFALNFQAGAFEAKKYTPNTGTQTVNIPTKTSHLSNDSGFITSAALTGYATQSWVRGLGYITSATANATFATKLGVSGNQIGTYVNGKLGNLITVPYAANADTVDGLHKSSLGQTFYNIALDANDYENLPYLYAGKLFNATNVPHTYYPFLHFGGGGFYAQFSAYGNMLKFRASKENDYTPDWKTVAFTDSNVASATKLQTARSLWGQSFDGTGNVSGDMAGVGSINMNGRIYFGDTTHYIEVDGNGYFHFSHGVYSDSFVSGKGSNPNAGGGVAGATALAELTDVSLSALANGQLLMYNGSKWTNVAQSTIVPTLKNLTFGSKTYNGTTAQTITAADLGALTSHQTIYGLTFQAGTFSTKTYTPNEGAQTVNIPTQTSHLTNNSGFITSAALSPYMTTATANATFATKLGVEGTQIGTYVEGVLGNLITVPYATNADTVDGLHKDNLAQTFYNSALDANNYTSLPYIYGGKLLNATNAPFNYYAFLHFGGGNYYAQFNAFGNRLQYRASKEDDYTPEWKEVAFIDSNVASATKLQTARTIWGQTFDGSQNIGGDFKMDKDDFGRRVRIAKDTARIYYTAGTTTWAEGLFLQNNAESSHLSSLGFYGIGDTLSYIFLGGTYASPKMVIDASGKIGVGTQTPAYNFDVVGVIHSTAGFITETDVRLNNRIYFKGTDHYIEVDATGLFHFSHGVYTDGTLAARGFNNSGSTISLWGNTYDGKNSIDGVIRSIYAANPTDGTIIGKFLAKKSDPLGLVLRTYTTGATSIQSQREDDSERFILSLNPLGGNVAINQTSASYTLDVAGTIKASVDIIATGTVTAKDFIKPSDARLKTYMEDVTLSVMDVANAPAWRYKWKSDGSVDVGSTTQYWGAIIPELTHKLPDGKYFGLDYGKTALLSVIAVARTVQSHEERIAELERENEQLKQTLKKYIS